MKNKKSHFFPGLAVFIVSLACNAPAFSQTAPGVREQIDRIQALIDQNGGKWVAGETSLSGLSREEWLRRVGLSITELAAPPVPDSPADRVPSGVDWRNANGNFVSGIRNQKTCGSCWSFALTGALESYVMRAQNTPGADLDLSEQVLLSCSGVGSCNGGTLNADYLQTTGLPPEADYPYTATDGVCSAASAGWQNETYKINGWGSVSHSLSSIKSALAKYGPLPTAMIVYEDLMHYKSGVYSYTTGNKLGGHAVLLVGYSDAGQYFIVKNSWGTGWGENGFFRLAYSELSSVTSFGLNTIAYKSNNPKGYYAAPTGFNSADAWVRTAPMFEPLLQWSK